MRGLPEEPAVDDVPTLARILRPFQRFIATEAASGIVLLVCTALALAWANSPWAGAYHRTWDHPLVVGAGRAGLTLPLHAWVNDGLMTVFFFLVGLEIKRELISGELSSRRSATLPIAAAIGGMLAPAALYAFVNSSGPGRAGWGVPMATDIAFALGILALLGGRVPSTLRVFLAALAIADDLGAVLVIALFYTSGIHWLALAGAAGVLAVLVGLGARGVRTPLPWIALGCVLWLLLLRSGIHATIAGVLLALTVPAGELLERFEHSLEGVVAFVVMPVFALANAGVALGAGATAAAGSPIAWGIALGLVLGKPIGITLASYAAVRLGLSDLPAGVRWSQLQGASWLGGIGFTMSLFIAGLAFGQSALLDVAKIGVLGASVIAGAIGSLVLWGASGVSSQPRAGNGL